MAAVRRRWVLQGSGLDLGLCWGRWVGRGNRRFWDRLEEQCCEVLHVGM